LTAYSIEQETHERNGCTITMCLIVQPDVGNYAETGMKRLYAHNTKKRNQPQG